MLRKHTARAKNVITANRANPENPFDAFNGDDRLKFIQNEHPVLLCAS